MAYWEKAVVGDAPAQTFIRDTMDGQPLQRSDINVPHQNQNPEEMSDEALAARIAELEDEERTVR